MHLPTLFPMTAVAVGIALLLVLIAAGFSALGMLVEQEPPGTGR